MANHAHGSHAGHDHEAHGGHGAGDPDAPEHDGSSGAPAEHADAEHGHDHAHDLRHTPMTRLALALVITGGFMFVEAGVGWWSNSLALLADAGHMLADAAALALAIVAQRIASQERTRARTYGFRRAEVLAAFANGIALALTAIWIFVEAAQRWSAPPEIRATIMTVTAVIGLLVNLACAWMLAAGAHGHNLNTRGALAHVMTDAAGSVGAIAAGLLVAFAGWNRADPVISAAIGVLVLWGGYRLVRETTRVLMEGSPLEIEIAHVEDTLRAVPGVVDFHDLHVWSISDGFVVLTVHLVIKRGYHGTDVVAAAAASLRERHGLEHCTIQPEASQEQSLVTLRRRPAASA